MKSYAPCLAVMIVGVVMMGYAAIGVVEESSRGRVAETRKAPPTPVRRTAGLRARFDNTPPGKTVWARLP